MKIPRLLAIWLVSIALSGIFILVVALYPLPNTITDPTEQAIPKAPIVVIGSSLMRYAVPGLGSGDNGGILGDGRPHVRLAVSSISEEQVLRLLEKLLHQDVKLIFFETNPFVFDFAHKKDNSRQSSSLSIAVLMKQKSQDLALKLNKLLGRGSSHEVMTADDASRLANTFQVNLNEAKKYPLYLRLPKHSEELYKLINSLKRKGVKVILIAPPRSMWSAQFIGDVATKNLGSFHQNLAKQLNLPLFQPDSFWENENFWDSAHMNSTGRQRFLQELKVWWNTQK
ncbi:MAG: hypothetical protein L3K52_13810 [Candidatus Thiothrix sulfatifontis]|nr:MAG: hypothetical protein L3K52_13810 [Candidatus Thiothrix sulfatifontis]